MLPGEPQLYFHRPLQTLFGAAFDAGFVLDALVEPGFPQLALPSFSKGTG